VLELAKIAFPEVERLARSGNAVTILPVGMAKSMACFGPRGIGLQALPRPREDVGFYRSKRIPIHLFER